MSVDAIIGTWHQTTDPKLFTADEVINAYFRGKKELGSAISRVLAKELEDNLKKIQAIGEDLFTTINSKRIRCSRVLLKIDDLSSFKLLFMVNELDYSLEKLREVYALLIDKEQSESSDTFHFSTSILSDSPKVNKQRVFSDGYYLCYGK
jgi:hypothetical protein